MQVIITPWKIIEYKVVNSHAIKPRLLANVLVILVKILVKRTLMGGHGGGSPSAQLRGQGPGDTLGRGSYAWLIVLREDHGPWANPHLVQQGATGLAPMAPKGMVSLWLLANTVAKKARLGGRPPHGPPLTLWVRFWLVSLVNSPIFWDWL